MEKTPSEEKEVRLAFVKGRHQFFFLYDQVALRFLDLVGRKAATDRNETEIEVEGNTTFDKNHLEAIVDFYVESNWQPRTIKKIWSNRLSDYQITEPEYAFLLRCADSKQLAKLYECASYFKLLAPSRLCFLALGSRVRYDHTDLTSLQSVAESFDITDPLDVLKIDALQKKYSFLNVPPDISDESLSGEEEYEEGEEEGEEEMQQQAPEK